MIRIIKSINLLFNLKKSREDILNIQLRKLKRIIRYAYKNVPFYREHFDSFNILPEDIKTLDDLKKLPMITKDDLRKAGDSRFSIKYKKNNCKSDSSSGSTGEPFVSYFDRSAWFLLKNISKLRSKYLCGLKLGDKVVNIECNSKKELSFMNTTSFFKDKILKLRYLSLHEGLEKHIEYFKKFKPRVLYGLSSYFLELAVYIEKNNITLPSVEIIFTSGEMIDVVTKNKLKKYFGKNVFNIYGSTEVMEISFECPEHSGYHTNDDLLYVEFSKYKKTEDTEIVVTSLENKMMPLIRYSVGDMGEKLDEICNCGLNFSLMKPTLGRSINYIKLEGGKKVSPYLFTSGMEKIPGVYKYQIIQNKLDEIEVKRITDSARIRAIKISIKKMLQMLLGKNCNIKIIDCQDIPREKTGKYSVVKCNIK